MSVDSPAFAQLPRRDKVLHFHNSLLDASTSASVVELWKISGWSSEEAQRTRFERLLRAASYAGGSVLDWGCGGGALYEHLQQVGREFEYCGIDLNPRLIKIAEERFGARFQVISEDYRLVQSYDYIFASGLFQFVDSRDPRYYLDVIRNMYDCSCSAVAVNFLSALRDERQKVNYELYIDPLAIQNDLIGVTRSWLLDHSYHPGQGDFTVALHKPKLTSWARPSFTL